MDKYNFFEKEVDETTKNNNGLIKQFKTFLEGLSLKPKTIDKHTSNVDFYINYFLLYYKIIPAENGATEIGEFLGDFFIRKAMWSSQASVKENISSLKKFYSFLNKIRKTHDDDLEEMLFIIKTEKNEWLMRVKEYNDNLGNDDW